ncbi:MAG: HAD hydrolase-like protein [Desulfurococcaceae archaeon]|nr:HAD hydrolase-like protein [Desulfurococcaceae archaeon]
MNCTLVVDIDGTLIPVLVDFEELRRKVRRVLGVNDPLKPLGESLHRLRIDESLKRKAWGVIEEAELESTSRLNTADLEVNAETIRRAVKSGLRVVVVTTRSYKTARIVLEKLGLLGITGELVTRDYTPIRADQLRYIIEKYTGRVVFIGDTVYDEKAAREVGVEFIKVESYRDLPRVVEEIIQKCTSS